MSSHFFILVKCLLHRREVAAYIVQSKHPLDLKQRIDNCFFTNICYNIITPVIKLRRCFYAT